MARIMEYRDIALDDLVIGKGCTGSGFLDKWTA